MDVQYDTCATVNRMIDHGSTVSMHVGSRWRREGGAVGGQEKRGEIIPVDLHWVGC